MWRICAVRLLSIKNAIPLLFRKLRKTAWSIYLEKRNKTEQQGKKKQERRQKERTNKRKEKQQNKTSTNATTTAKTWSGSPSKFFPITPAHCSKNKAQYCILNTRFTSSNYIHLCLSIWCFQVLNGLLSKNRIVTPCTCINFEAAASLQQDLLESNVDVQGRWSHDAASDQHELKRHDKALAKRLWKIYTSIHPSRLDGDQKDIIQIPSHRIKPSLWSQFEITSIYTAGKL